LSEFLMTTIDKFILRVKKDLIYSKDYVWVEEEDGKHNLGLTNYAQRRYDDIVFLRGQGAFRLRDHLDESSLTGYPCAASGEKLLSSGIPR
jgi:hypothetical protein